MKIKVFRHYIILIIISISLMGVFASRIAQNFYRTEVEEKLVNSAALMEHQISGSINEGKQADYDQLARKYADVMANYGGAVSTRVTFIAFDGKVLGESNTNRDQMENHLGRKEVEAALRGDIGKDMRFSKTLKMNFLYVALPLTADKVVLRVSVPLWRVEIINRYVWYYVLASILASILIMAIPAYRFSASLTNPINELNIISKEIALGNYTRRAVTKAHDELGQLAQSFNDMAGKLESTVADLTDKNMRLDSIIDSLNSGIVAVDSRYRIILVNGIACKLLEMDPDPRLIGKNIFTVLRNSHINTALSETIENNSLSIVETNFGLPEERNLRIYTSPIKSMEHPEANSGGIISVHDITNIKKLEQIRTDFVSNVTHELKTPLTSIRGFIETLRGGALEEKEVADKFLEIIDIEAERLSMLINDILQLSEIETRQKDINIGKHSLYSIVEEVISILRGVADSKGIALSFDTDKSIIVAVNRDRIKQLLINLVDNAIKYNKEGGTVVVKGHRNEGRVVISVQDTGIGIPPEYTSRIFERFYRVDKGRSRSMGGTGLGLSIVKHIVNLYNGDIKVHSEPGKGTEFIIQLPI